MFKKSRPFIIVEVFGLLLALYFILRLIFLLLNLHTYGPVDLSDILFSFIHGLRFDLASIVMLNIPFVLVSLVPQLILPHKFYRVLVGIWLYVINIPFLLMNIADAEYYKFVGRRATSEVQDFKGEALAQLGQFFVNYWYLVIFSFLIIYVFHKFLVKILKKQREPLPFHWGFACLISFLVFNIFAFRGGIQKKTLKVSHAYTSTQEILGHLTLNSSFSFLHSLDNESVPRKSYFNSDEEVYAQIRKKFNSSAPQKKQNVVVIILESLATEFWGSANEYVGYTPFLDELSSKSLFFKNNFANARRSIEALPAVWFGIPSMMQRPVAISNYQSNNWTSMAHTLGEYGYHTSFFHGAKKGTMYFDMISNRAGTQDYYPLERYEGSSEDFDGQWGIYDEPFLQFMVEKLETFPKPFFTTVFTISTHQPYQVPPKYKDRFPEGSLKIHQSVRYVDYSLEKFFEAAKKTTWYKDTLFVLTADHTQMSESEFYNNTLGNFMVPLLFFHPAGDVEQRVSNRVTQHADIYPSVMDFLGLNPKEITLFGQSVFEDQNAKGEAILFLGNDYVLVNDDYYLQFNPENETSKLYALSDKEKKRALDQKAISSSMEKKLKAYIQYHNNTLINNSLYDWKRSNN